MIILVSICRSSNWSHCGFSIYVNKQTKTDASTDDVPSKKTKKDNGAPEVVVEKTQPSQPAEAASAPSEVLQCFKAKSMI